MPKVTLITSVYNGCQHIENAFHNIALQTHKDFEWIIVDDGSEDETSRLVERAIDEYDGIRAQLIRSERVGRSSALNLAIAAADSEFICNQDVDDLSTPNRIVLQESFLSEHSDVGALGGGYDVVDEIRGLRFTRYPPTEHEALLRQMAKCVPFAHTIAAFRRQAWEDVGGYPIISAHVDLSLWINMVGDGWKMAALDQVLGTHHIYAGSFWARTYSSSAKQNLLAKVQSRAIREFGLPPYYYVYPLARFLYRFVPNRFRANVRAVVSSAQEEDYKAIDPAARSQADAKVKGGS